MKWTVDQSHLPAFVSVETSGDPEPKDFVSMWREILSSEFWRPGIPVLVDNQKLKPMKDPDAFTTDAIDFFSDNVESFGATCVAAVSSLPDNFKYARQFQYGIRLKGSDVVLQIFGSRTQAVEWLDHYSQVRQREGNVERA
jgi:hypothetical protein